MLGLRFWCSRPIPTLSFFACFEDGEWSFGVRFPGEDEGGLVVGCDSGLSTHRTQIGETSLFCWLLLNLRFFAFFFFSDIDCFSVFVLGGLAFHTSWRRCPCVRFVSSTDIAAAAAVLAPAGLFTIFVFRFVYVALGLIYSIFSDFSLVLLFPIFLFTFLIHFVH